MSKSKNINSLDYKHRLNNARIFADALFNGEIKLLHEVNNKKILAVYVSKEISEKTVEETVSLKEGKQRAESA
ncbi:MAG: hypothetical protein RDU14_16930 [Melioribacteraceae bacterium]|nr:hypothetical protein [Melioribacteraceae bacterium]